MVYGAQNKTSYVRDTSLQPFQAKTEQLEFDLPVDDKGAPTVRDVEVTVELNYEIQNPDNKVQIHKVTRQVIARPLDRATKHKNAKGSPPNGGEPLASARGTDNDRQDDGGCRPPEWRVDRC